jgi:biotin carboxyl carrier protein
MLFFIRYKGTENRVRVESRNHQIFVKFNEEPEEAVDLAYFGHDCTFLDKDRNFFANIVGDKTDYTVWRPEGPMSFEVESEYRRIVSLLRGQEFENENNVYAKMPGKIVKILAAEGQAVEKGQSVIVMEAMKMENEVRTARAATVSKVCVKEGQAVETGELLMELSGGDSDA